MTSFPIAPKRPKEITRHGQTQVDNYFWMSHKEDPEVRNYLRAEQDHLEEVTQHTKPLQETLLLEMKGRIKEETSPHPKRMASWSGRVSELFPIND
jgi:oligopeptidase B